jgi:peptidoglycan-associated lipoprotein
MGASTIAGTLNITANGAVTQSGPLAVTGATTLAAGATNDITLTNAANNFSTINVTSGNNVTLRDSNALGLGSLTLSGILDVTANGGITDANGAATNITAPSASLAATSIGTAANPIETNLGSLTATTTAGGIFVSQAGPISLNNIVAGSGNIVINNSLGDMTINTVQASAGGVNLTTAGSILDSNGPANNVTASADSTLNALGVIGRSIDPLEVNVTGALGVAASNQIDNISVIINGTVSPANTLMTLNAPPGEVIFNGVVLYPLALAAGGSPPGTPDLGLFVRNSSTLKTEDMIWGSEAVIIVAEDVTPSDASEDDNTFRSTGGIESQISDETPPTAAGSDPASASALQSLPSLSTTNLDQHPTEVEETDEVRVREEPIVVANAVPPESGHDEVDQRPDHSEDPDQHSAPADIVHEQSALASRSGGTTRENGVSPAFDEGSRAGAGAHPLADRSRLAEAAEATGELKDVPFDFESWRVSEEVMQALIEVAKWMRTNPTKRLIIAGHADERGTSSYNLALGEKRAKTIRNILIDLGVEADRLKALSYGKERPLCRESHEACYRQNRRGHLEADVHEAGWIGIQ